jgi:uroporphyrinogen-III synthase
MEQNKLYTVVITRPEKQSRDFENALLRAGFNTVKFPVIEIKNRPAGPENKKVLDELNKGSFNWLVFTSANAVEALYEMQGEEKTIPENVKIAVIGDKTEAALKKYFRKEASLKPAEFVAEALLEEFKKVSLNKSKVLLVLASKTRDVIREELVTCGAEVETLIAYDNLELSADPVLLKKLEGYPADKLIFTFFSPSAVNSAIAILTDNLEILKHSCIISIGPVTSKALNEKGLKISIESQEHSEEGVLTIINKYVSLNRND